MKEFQSYPTTFMKLVLVLLIVLGSQSGWTQSISVSRGGIPSGFSFEEREKRIDSYNYKRGTGTTPDKAAEAQFLQRAQFTVNQLMTGGKVLFGDEMTDYLNDILENLTKGNPTLRDQIHVYTYKSSVPNAFMTIGGNLFVTTGLLAQVQNETEIAFVMAHEIGHNVNNDLLRAFKTEWNTRQITNSLDLFELGQLEYSKELELEADLFGLDLLTHSSIYDPIEALSVFEVLLYSYLPFDEVVFDFNYIVPNGTDIPSELIIQDVNPITTFEDYNDAESTHPNIKDRKERYLEKLVSYEEVASANPNPLGSERFTRIQSLARNNVIRSELAAQNYIEALYNLYVLSIQDSLTTEAYRANVGYVLRTIAKYKNEGVFHEISPNPERTEGQIHKLHHFMRSIDDIDLAGLALLYNYELHLAFPKNEFIRRNLQQCTEDIVMDYDWTLDDFTINPNIPELSSSTEIKENEELLSSNHDFLNDGWTKSLLYPYRNDQQLNEYFENAYYLADTIIWTNNIRPIEWSSIVDIQELLEYEYHLNLKEAIYLEPMCYDIDGVNYYNPSGNLNLIETYDLIKAMNISTLEVLDQTSFGVNYLSPSSFAEEDVEDYNDHALLISYVEEFMAHDGVDVSPSTHIEMLDIANRYGTRYIILPKVFRIHARDFNSFGKHFFFFGMMVFDIINDELLMVDLKEYRTEAAKGDYQRMIIYESLLSVLEP